MSAEQTPVGMIFVVADEGGHALAVVATLEDAKQAARDDALAVAKDVYEDDGNGFSFVWTIRVDERSPQWTELTAKLAGESEADSGSVFAKYVITRLAAGEGTGGTFVQDAPRPQVRVLRTELAVRDEQGDLRATEPNPAEAPEASEGAATTEGSSPAAAAPQAAEEPAERTKTSKAAKGAAPEVKCEGGYEGCNGTVETTEQVLLSQTRQRAALCSSCFKHEVREQIPARVA